MVEELLLYFQILLKLEEKEWEGKLKNYPKIPGELFARKVVEIINGKYKEYSGFMFEINSNNKVILYGLNPSKITGAFEYHERKSLEEIGEAVYYFFLLIFFNDNNTSCIRLFFNKIYGNNC